MWPQDTKNYMQQMKRSIAMEKINKEKEMQKEIMSLKSENQMLKNEIRQFADALWIISRKYKEQLQENTRLKKEWIFYPVKI